MRLEMQEIMNADKITKMKYHFAKKGYLQHELWWVLASLPDRIEALPKYSIYNDKETIQLNEEIAEAYAKLVEYDFTQEELEELKRVMRGE